MTATSEQRSVYKAVVFVLALVLAGCATPPRPRDFVSGVTSAGSPVGSNRAARYTGTYENSWAIVIGVNAYQKLHPLTYAVADAKAVANLLPSLGFPKEHILLLLDDGATKSGIESTLYRTLRPRMGPNDRLLVYFAGHGETLPLRDGEEGYILPVDSDPEALPATALAMQDIQRIAQRLPAKHYLFILDACFSGFAATRAAEAEKTPSEEYIASALREPVVQVITAGRKGQRAIEDAGHGLFTRYLLEALSGQADQEVASRVVWKKRNGAFFRLVKCTTSRPPCQAATGGTRHGERYQEAGRYA